MTALLRLPTASSLDRAEHCPTSFSLAKVIETNEDAERGTEVHAFISHVIGGMKREDAAALIREKETKVLCLSLDFATLVGDLGDVRSEAAYGFQIKNRTVIEFGSSIARAYPAIDDDTIAGTSDIEGRRITGRVVTRDIKSGFADRTDPKLARQMHYHAVVRRRALDVDEVEAGICRIGESGKVKMIEHTFDGFDLDTIEDDIIDIFSEVKATHERMMNGAPFQVNPGSWCRWCESKPVCPAFAGLAREMLPELKRVGGMIAGVMKMTPTEQFRIFELVKQAQTLLDSIMPRLKAIAEHAPFVSEDGTREVRVTSYEKENFSKVLALELLAAKGATPEEIAALYSAIEIKTVRMVNVKAPKVSAKAKRELDKARDVAALEQAPKLKPLPMVEDRSAEQLELDGDGPSRSPMARMRERENDR